MAVRDTQQSKIVANISELTAFSKDKRPRNSNEELHFEPIFARFRLLQAENQQEKVRVSVAYASHTHKRGGDFSC